MKQKKVDDDSKQLLYDYNYYSSENLQICFKKLNLYILYFLPEKTCTEGRVKKNENCNLNKKICKKFLSQNYIYYLII